MLLRYLGIRITVNEFVDFFLPQGQMSRKEGKLIGCDPEKEFAGSPYEKNSFGCYPGVLIKAMNDCFLQKGMAYTAIDATGLSTKEILAEGIDADMPVLYWVTHDLNPPALELSWTIKDTGKKVNWYRNLHCVLMTGYEEDTLDFINPGETTVREIVSRSLAMRRHAELGRRTVIVKKDY
jgi:uncharacterized protein YvpB